MTNAMNASPSPVVCTLSAPDLAERSLEWADLAALSLTTERIDGGVASTYPLDYWDLITDLASRESSCCGSWLNSSTTQIQGVIRLELTTENPDGLALISLMAGLGS